MKYALYSVFIILPLYTDSMFGLMLGSYGYAPVAPLSLLGIFLALCLGMWKGSTQGPFGRRLSFLLLYLVAINICSLASWFVMGGEQTLYGESVISKAIKGCIIAGSIVSYVYLLNILSRSLSEEMALRPFLFAFFIMCAVAIIEYSQMPTALSFLHYNGQELYWRPRLLNSESSMTTLQVVVYGGVSLFYSASVRKSRALSLLVSSGLLFLVLSSGSKSLGVIVLVALVFYVGARCKHDARWLVVVLGCLLLLALFPGVVGDIFASFENDIENFTSVATRTFSILVALLVSLLHPFGVGNALYLHYYPQMMFDCLGWVPASFDMSEVLGYLNSGSDYGLSAKSGVFQWGLYWGILGTIVFLTAVFSSSKHIAENTKRNPVLISTCVLACLIVLLVDSFEFQYCFFALFFLGDFYKRRQVDGEARCRDA